jgi:CCR4-NOT transcription complex subunit 10
MHSQPRIWLRLGEACVAVHVQQQKEQQHSEGVAAVSPLVASLAAGSGPQGSNAATSRRYLLLPTDGPSTATLAAGPPPEGSEGQPAAGAVEGGAGGGGGGGGACGGGGGGASTGAPAPPAPTLTYGVKCLRNAVLQCGAQLGGAQLASISASEYANLLASSAAGTLSSTDEHTMQLHCVQRLAQLHLSWCALEATDYVPALSWASQLLGIEACPASLRAYAHLYACDALCHLNRVDEALAHLTAALELGEPLTPVASSTGADITSQAEGEGLDCVRNPYSPLSAPPSAGHASGAAAAVNSSGKAALYTNLAVVQSLQGNLEAAEGYLQQALALQPDCRQALLCGVYVELRSGHTEAAVELLKKQRRAGK